LGLFQTEAPLPDLVYGGDGEELMAKLDELGLVAHVGVMPHFRRIPKDVDLPQGSWPYAFGHSLYLDIELRGA
jgi:predicted ABC-class ATPase